MSDFESFKNSFKGDLVTPTDASYAQAVARWAINAERNAKIVAFVKDAEDASLAIRYAQAAKLPLAVRGGGHSPSGASSSEGGLVVDLSRYLGEVKVDPEQKLAYVGGGSIWGSVDVATIKHGLATVAGTVSHTGVGGLLLGGGYGWLSGAHGLALDNIAQVTIVTADGSILTANDTEHTDLFWAVRGGGSNFGVVTEFVLKLYPQRKTIYAGPVIFSVDKTEALVALANQRLEAGLSPHEGAVHIFTTDHDGKPCIVVIVFFNGSEAEGRAHWKDLLDIGPIVDHSAEIPYETLNTLQNPEAEHGYGSYMKGVYQVKPNYEDLRAAHARANEFATANPDFLKTNLMIEYFPLTKMNSAPAGATAFRRSGAGNALVLLKWVTNTPENEAKAREIGPELAGIISRGQAALLGPENSGYGNYGTPMCGTTGVVPAEKSSKSKAELLFGDHYPRLQVIKKKYDPESVFAKWFAIVPAN
ncbi:hypothetical protein PLICRDRAFT_103835 [Plicaturopsis crispa FD-325 SS-3]|nr:hypothetical protein PLICRDRAFT_103835 [Plicaturopsis crispa FD-325 SS-3]